MTTFETLTPETLNSKKEIMAGCRLNSNKAYYHFIPNFIENLDTYAYGQMDYTKDEELNAIMIDFREYLINSIRNAPRGVMS